MPEVPSASAIDTAPVGLSTISRMVSSSSILISSSILKPGMAIGTVPSYVPDGIVTVTGLVNVKSVPAVAV